MIRNQFQESEEVSIVSISGPELKQALNLLIINAENSNLSPKEQSVAFQNKKLRNQIFKQEVQLEIYLPLLSGTVDEPVLDISKGVALARSTVMLLHCCIDQSRKLAEKDDPYPVLLCDEELKEIESAITFIKTLIKKEFSISEFVQVLSVEPVVPLELLLKLDDAGIIPVEVFLQQVINKSQLVSAFSKAVWKMCYQDNAPPARLHNVCSVIVSSLVMCAYFENFSQNRSLVKVTRLILDTLTKRYLENQEHFSVKKMNFISVLIKNPLVDRSAIQSFSSHILTLMLNHSPTVRVTHALRDQHKWLWKTADPILVGLLQKIVTVLSPEKVLNCLECVLESQEVNWKFLLMFTSLFLVCHPKAATLLENFIEKLLKVAFEKLEMESLISSVLLARQAALESFQVFPTYEEWFQKYFGDSETSLAGTPRTFAFLMKFLVDLAPYEPARYLKVHISKPPHVIPRCHQVFKDYVYLAKTRLKDFQETSNFGIYEQISDGQSDAPTTSKDHKKINQAETDVEKALQLYENTNKVPTSILEASIFRKPYFIGSFLPELLKPRPLPDIPDTRIKFIEELKQIGKIPLALYENYRKKSQKETETLLEGVMDVSFSEVMLEPQDDLKLTLETLRKALGREQSSNSLGEDDFIDICPLIAEASSKLQVIVDQLSSAQDKEQSVILVEDFKMISSDLLQIGSILIEGFVHCQQTAITLSKDTSWDVLYVSMLSCFPALHPPVFSDLWNKLVSETVSLKSQDIRSLSLLLLRLGQMGSSFPKLSYNRYSAPQLLPDLLFDYLPLNSQAQVKYYTDLTGSYLTWAIHTFVLTEDSTRLPDYISETMLKKFQFSSVRTHLELQELIIGKVSDKNLEPDSLITQLYCAPVFQHWCQEAVVNLSYWMKLEVQVQQDTGFAESDRRLEYLRCMIITHFLPLAQAQGGCDGNIRHACSSILEGLISLAPSLSFFSQFIIVLQELTHSLSIDGKSTQNVQPWLLEELERNIQKHSSLTGSELIVLHNTVDKFFRIVYALPPFLLLTDCLSIKPSSEVFQNLASKVSNCLRNYLYEECFLSNSLIAHLVKALFQTSNQHKELDSSIEKFLYFCPSFTAGLIIHWSRIGPLLRSVQLYNNTFSTLVRDIESVVSWSNEITDNSVLALPSGHFVIKWWFSLIIAQKLKRAVIPVSLITNVNSEILKNIVHFLMAYDASYSISNPSSFPPLLVKLLKICVKSSTVPKFFLPHSYQCSFVQTVVPTSVWSLCPAVCLSAVLQLWDSPEIREPDLEKHVLLDWLLVLLTNLTKCNREFINNVTKLLDK
ncbi:Fanconi anemia group A protein homolog [Limulus polyphemus]|uniref:Fanconi anemia group A protein homolog n=1 Tax=Limulus polyphemus TaxID=6850 RepID=A0ABM1BZK4_LIMPO|nr:Fanconi anemia group A protein homolog [Limulus polyphemus]